jgi:DNA-binding response OmpR family regulator
MPKVMVIEDDQVMASLVQVFLQMEGIDVVLLEKDPGLEEILESIHQEKPGLVLLDVNLKGLNGFDILSDIREDNDIKSTKVILSSGMDLGMQSYALGADGFLLKPYMPEELLELVHDKLRN